MTCFNLSELLRRAALRHRISGPLEPIRRKVRKEWAKDGEVSLGPGLASVEITSRPGRLGGIEILFVCPWCRRTARKLFISRRKLACRACVPHPLCLLSNTFWGRGLGRYFYFSNKSEELHMEAIEPGRRLGKRLRQRIARYDLKCLLDSGDLVNTLNRRKNLN